MQRSDIYARTRTGTRSPPSNGIASPGCGSDTNRVRWATKADRTLGHAYSEIARLVSALNLPHVVREEASVISIGCSRS